MTAVLGPTLSSRWGALRHHEKQARLFRCKTRFVVVPAGRRSGKTEIAKRRAVLEAMRLGAVRDSSWIVLAAPTHDQAKRIFWSDVKRLVPQEWMDGKPRESDLIIRLKTGAEIQVLGLDKPERIEGRPLDFIVIDEFASIKAAAWETNIRPALSTVDRLGGAWLIGVPEGMGRYQEFYKRGSDQGFPDWESFHWVSAEILPEEEIEAAKRDLDPMSFQQEYEASFLTFQGRAYYPFEHHIHCATAPEYAPNRPLILNFDFNVSPGVAVVAQEQNAPKNPESFTSAGLVLEDVVTSVIGEVYIPKRSNTQKVCRRLRQDWGHHSGEVYLYGDSTGGSSHTSQIHGTDWDTIRDEFRRVPGWDVTSMVPRSNPAERARVNAMNSRLRAAGGTIGMQINAQACPNLVRDFEAVTVLEGGSGELDKKKDDKNWTHLTDALGYYVVAEFPTSGAGSWEMEPIS